MSWGWRRSKEEEKMGALRQREVKWGNPGSWIPAGRAGRERPGLGVIGDSIVEGPSRARHCRSQTL